MFIKLLFSSIRQSIFYGGVSETESWFWDGVCMFSTFIIVLYMSMYLFHKCKLTSVLIYFNLFNNSYNKSDFSGCNNISLNAHGSFCS